MINNKCFYVYCKQGFVAYVWAESEAKAKGYAWRKSLGACDEFCGDYASLMSHRCHLLDGKYQDYCDYSDMLQRLQPDRYIDVCSDVGIKFLIVYFACLISLAEDSDTMVLHHSIEAKRTYELKIFDDWY